MKMWFLIGVFLSFCLSSFAQQGLQLQYEPTFSYSTKLSNRWSTNIKVASRNGFLSTAEESTAKYEMIFLESQFFATYALFGGTKLGGGYTIRGLSPLDGQIDFEHRATEQIAFISYIQASRLSHRVRTEQRFQPDSYINRWRYRISYDKPLEGDRLDPGEKYLILSDEVLYSFNSVGSSAENRLYVGIGWQLLNTQQLEAGVQYRLGDIGTSAWENIIWFTTTYYLKD